MWTREYIHVNPLNLSLFSFFYWFFNWRGGYEIMAVTVKITIPRTAGDKTRQTSKNLLYIIMFKSTKIKPNLSLVCQNTKSFHSDCYGLSYVIIKLRYIDLKLLLSIIFSILMPYLLNYNIHHHIPVYLGYIFYYSCFCCLTINE